MVLFALILGLLGGAAGSAQDGPREARPPSPAPAPRAAARPRLDATAQRNENVAVYLIDNNAIKEAGIRSGAVVTILPEQPVEMSHYAAEHGRPPAETVFLRPAPALDGWRAEFHEWHQNSVFNARSFFQVGAVKPARRNQYGGRLTGRLPGLGFLTTNAGQRKIRGMVNGNVLVPLADERAPRAADPALRSLIAGFLRAYPAELPNRPDFDPRALNTNSPQRIDDTDFDARLDRPTPGGNLSLFHALARQRVRAFQLVAGQNPDTEIHSHRSRIAYEPLVSPRTTLSLAFGFNRVKSVLLPEPNAAPYRLRMGYQIEELGPDSQFPIDRAQNSYRFGAILRRQLAGGGHALTAGGDFTRFQLNGIETNNQRPYYQFTSNFGFTAIENFLHGRPSMLEVTIGELARGYRNWSGNLYLADRWKLTSRLQLYYGLRYNFDTAPREVDNLDPIAYRSDLNNLSPRFSLAWQAGGSWTLRSSYTTSYGQILPVTYQQVRNNLPRVRYVQMQTPSLLDPYGGLTLDGPGRTSPTFLSPDLVAPYAHMYNLRLERQLPGDATLRLGYAGSRSFKLLNNFHLNRAAQIPGLAPTTQNVDQRRADPRYYDVKLVLNGGIAYLDAAQLTLELPVRGGLIWSLSYTFGKAIDEGVDYSATAANTDLTKGRSQSEFGVYADRKGLSAFDSTHALQLTAMYDLPRLVNGARWLGRMANGWQLSGVALLKSGTPFTLYIGSDSPGFGNVDGGPGDRPNIVDPSILGKTIDDPDTSAAIIRRDRFSFLAPGQMRGSIGRNTFRKDGIANLNAALTRQWRWNRGREWVAIFRAEAYNFTNHPQFDEPQRNLSSPSFGRITNTLNDGRVFQVGLRLVL